MAYYLGFPITTSEWVTTPDWIPTSSDNWSFEIFIKTPSSTSSDKTIVGRESFSNSNGRAWKLYINNGNMGLLHNSLWTAGGFIQAPVAASTEYLVRGEFDGTDIRLYFDNILVGSATGRNLLGANNLNHLSAFGRSIANNNSIITDLVIYDCKIYNDATQTTVARHYNPTLSAEAGGTLLIDEVGGNHGTLNGFSADPFVYYYDFLNPADEDTTNDNCLVFDGVDDYASVDINSQSGNSDPIWNLKFKLVNPDTTVSFIRVSGQGILANSTNRILIAGDGTELRYYKDDGNSSYSWNITSNPATDIYELNVAGSQSGVELLINGVSQGFQGAGFGIGIEHDFLGVNFNTYYKGGFEYVIFTTPDDSTLNRFYDFNRSPATAPVVPELINNQNGTMVGFPEPSGYVKNASNEIIGYRFNGVDTYARNITPIVKASNFSIQLNFSMNSFESSPPFDYLFTMWNSRGLFLQNSTPKIALYLVPFTVVNYTLPAPLVVGDDLELHIDVVDIGGGDVDVTLSLAINDGALTSLGTQTTPASGFADANTVFAARKNYTSQSNVTYKYGKYSESGVIKHNWNFTLGDDDDIKDTVGDRDLEIINAPTAGYLPIIEKQVFTVGGAGGVADYELNSTTILDMISSADAADAQLYLLIVENIALDNYVALREANYPAIIDGGIPFNGDFNDSVNNRIIDDTLALSRAFLCYGSWSFKNFALVGGKGYIQNPRNPTDISGVGFSKVNVYANGDIIRINNSVVTGSLDTSVGSDANNYRQFEVYNSVLAEKMIIRNYSSCEFVNSISIGSGFNLDTANYVGATINVKNSRIKAALGSIIPVDGGGNIDSLSTLDADAFNDPANGDYRVLQTYADTNLVGQGWNGSDIGASFYFDGSTPPVSATDTVKVLRGSTIIADGQTALTLQNGVDYTLEDTDDSKWYFRITNNHFTGMGTTSGGGNQLPDRFTVHTVQSGADVILNRPDGTNDNRVDWEIVQYSGNTPENEFIIREKGNITLADTELTQTVALPTSVVNADDVVILITGQSTTNSSSSAVNTGLFTAVRGASDWVATRGKVNLAANLSYAIIEYTGSDYTVTQESFVASTNVDTHTLVTPVADSAQTFIHAHYRYESTAASGLDDSSVRVYLQDANTISIHNDTGAELALKQHHVYLIQNPNLSVQRHTGEMAGVGEEELHGVAITTVANIELSSLGGLSASSTGSGTALPRGYINFTLENDSSVMLRQSDNGQTSRYAFEVIEWPAGDVGGLTEVNVTIDIDADLIGRLQATQDIDASLRSQASSSASISTSFTVPVTGTISLDSSLQSQALSRPSLSTSLKSQVSAAQDVAASLIGRVDVLRDINIDLLVSGISSITALASMTTSMVSRVVNVSSNIDAFLLGHIETYAPVTTSTRAELSQIKDVTTGMRNLVSTDESVIASLRGAINTPVDIDTSMTVSAQAFADFDTSLRGSAGEAIRDIDVSLMGRLAQTQDLLLSLTGRAVSTHNITSGLIGRTQSYADVSFALFGSIDWDAPASRVSITLSTDKPLISFSEDKPLINFSTHKPII